MGATTAPSTSCSPPTGSWPTRIEAVTVPTSAAPFDAWLAAADRIAYWSAAELPRLTLGQCLGVMSLLELEGGKRQMRRTGRFPA